MGEVSKIWDTPGSFVCKITKMGRILTIAGLGKIGLFEIIHIFGIREIAALNDMDTIKITRWERWRSKSCARLSCSKPEAALHGIIYSKEIWISPLSMV